MTTKITLTDTLEENYLEVIAKGLGYSETSTEIDPETNEWKVEAEAQRQKDLASSQVESLIQSVREVNIETT